MSKAIWRRWTVSGEDPLIYLDDVFRYALSRLDDREEAEDVAIETVQALPNPCRKRELRLYMIGIARRKIVDRLRSRRPQATLLDSDATERFDHAADEALMVDRIMKSLADDYREVLWLKYVEGLSSKEIGALTAKSAPAVDSLLQRARSAFENAWNDCFGEENEDDRT